MKTLADLGVNTTTHAVRKAELESALRVREGAQRGAAFLRFVGLPLLLLVVVVSAIHAVSFFSGEAVTDDVKGYVALGNIVSIDLLLVFLVVAEAALALVGLAKKGYHVLYLRSLVAFLNASVLLVEFGHLASWMAYLVPWAGSVTVILFLPFFFVAVPAVEDVRGRLNEALSKLAEEIAALKGALEEAVDPELVAAREKVTELELKLTQAEADRAALNSKIDQLTAAKAELGLEVAAQAEELAEMRRLLAEANENVRLLVEKLAQAGEKALAAPAPAKAARKQVEAECEECHETIVGFGAVGTSRREAPKFGGRVLCGACRDQAKEAA